MDDSTLLRPLLFHQALLTAYQKWKQKYPSMVKSLSNNENLFTFYDYPECVRQTIHSTI